MNTWDVFYIIDRNESPPVVTYFNSQRDQHDCLENIRDADKDLDLVELHMTKLRRGKKTVTEFVNRQVRFTRQLAAFEDPDPIDDDELPKKPRHRHLRVVK